jgi:DNA-binding NarL/FixJ family response regulator
VLEQLTEKERRVAELVVRGRTNHEVAERLHLSHKTVEWTLTKVYKKLHVRSRTELAFTVRIHPGETPGTEVASSGERPPGPATGRGEA